MSFSRGAVIKDRIGRFVFETAHAALPERYTRYLGPASHLRALLNDLGVECVIDVGANTGGYRDFLRRRCGYRGKILSFEPVRALADGLRQRAACDANWFIHGHALGAQDGQRELNVARNTVFSSFLDPDHSIVDQYTQNVVDHVETVEVRRLDGLLGQLSARHGFDDFYLKMDTQGFDLEVLEGAAGVLERTVALQTEVSVRPIYQGMPDYRDSIAALGERGFDLSGLYAVSRDQYHRVVEFDCFAVNSRRLDAFRSPSRALSA